ncbi:MAG: helix-turn-helix domain-containing protein [Planctomycetota bacterium]|jgi:transcriptional regulator with XRE-family HTH domain
MTPPTPPQSTSSPASPDASLAIQQRLCQRVKELRKERKWSLDSLSAACGVSRSMLSQIERGQANPTLAVTFRIAEAFGMNIAEFIESPHASNRIDVIRSDDHAYHYRSDGDCDIRTLSPLHMEKDVELYEIRLKAGGVLESSPHFKQTREFLTVQKGKVRVRSADDEETLGRGDSASYRADVPHAIENAGSGEAIVILVVNYK